MESNDYFYRAHQEAAVQLFSTLKERIQASIAPLTTVDNAEANQQRRRLLVMIMTLGLLFTTVLGIPTAFIQPNVLGELITFVGGSLLFALAYWLAHRGRENDGAMLLVATISVGVLALILSNGNSVTTPYYFAISVLVASIVLRPRQLWLVLAANLAGLWVVSSVTHPSNVPDAITQLARIDHVFLMVAVAILGFLSSTTVERAISIAQKAQERAEALSAELEQRVAERTAVLRDSEARYRDSEATKSALLAAMPDLMFHMRDDGTILAVHTNSPDDLLVPVEAMLGQPIEAVVPPEIAAQTLRTIREALRTRALQHYEYRLAMGADEREWEARAVAVNDHEALVLVRDVTERKRAEAARLEMERSMLHTQKLESLGVLAGGVAHDFNNLLTGILGNAELLAFDLPPSSDAHNMLAQIALSARRAAELTQQILAYAGKGRFIVGPLNLNRLITEMPQLLDALLPKAVALHLNLAPALPAIDADAAQLRQVVLNLLLNAAEAMPPGGGDITCTTHVRFFDAHTLASTYRAPELPAAEYVELEVCDTGAGMTTDTIARIFDPFFTTKFAGRGLGLAAVLGIVQGHRGAVYVRSAVGAGTTFSIVFPLSAADTPKSSPQPQRAWRPAGHGTVLVVDDEAPIRLLLRRMFEQQGFSVLTAADGQEGIDVLRASGDAVVCVLLDLTMPRLDGSITFAAMRQLNPALPIIVMSGYSAESVSEQFPPSDPLHYLQKPFAVGDVWEALQGVGVV